VYNQNNGGVLIMAKSQILNLTKEEIKQLEENIRARTTQSQVVNRSRILLLKADGKSIDTIAEKLDLNRKSVLLCIKKFREGGIDNALSDAPGRGRNPEITDDEKAWIINIACCKPTELGYAAETWTYAKLTRHINITAESVGYTRLSTLTKTSIKNILDAAEIKPFKIKYYCEKRDPDFEQKMHEVLVVYKQVEMMFDEEGNLLPIEGAKTHTLSYDEKPGIQAIATTSADRAPIPGIGYTQRDYEYKRLGTLSLLAGIDLLTGEAIPLVAESHKSSDFIQFLKILNEKYPKTDRLRIILDNHSAHISKETRKFLTIHPGRFEFVFTPKHGSWLNLIESFFSKMSKQMLRGIRVQSKEELEMRIYQYFNEVNEEPVVYHWKYKMDEIELEESS
jgi:transposase